MSEQNANFQNRIVGEAVEHADQLLANPKNWRTHPKAQRKALEATLDEIGWIQRVIVNKRTGVIIDGHLRVELAIQRDEAVPVLYVDLSEQEEALALATIDPIAGMAGTDKDLLSQLLHEIDTVNPIIQEFLSELAEQNRLADFEEDKQGATDEDDIPACPKTPTSQVGDVWHLGPHRLLVGDSTDPAALDPLMNGDQADLVWTDPPYNVDYSGKNEYLNAADKGSRNSRDIQNDAMNDAAFSNFLNDALGAAFYHTRNGGAIYVAHADSNGHHFRSAFMAAGYSLKQCIIWIKQHFVLGRQDYQWQHEPILYGWKPGASHYFTPDRSNTTVYEKPSAPFEKWSKNDLVAYFKNASEQPGSIIRWDKPSKSQLHPTMKPVGLVAFQIKNSTKKGDIILDLFGGSGTTMIAADKTHRRARLVEIDPIYADVIIKRYQEWDEAEATLQDDGRTFTEIKRSRTK